METKVMKISGVGCAAVLASAFLLTSPQSARAQAGGGAATLRPAVKVTQTRRTLTLEILIQSQPAYRVKAQEWGRLLQELGYAPRFREAIQGEKIRIEEQLQDGRDSVLVVGGMTSGGALKFSGRSFTVSERTELGKYLAELKEHGAGGMPAGNPRWGLTETQFQEFVKLMNSPMENPVELSTAGGTVRSLGLPAEVSVVFSETAFAVSLQTRPDFVPESLELTGISRGTALAIVLAQYGLGFRPVLNKAGGYAIEIEPGNESSNLWPVGWKSQESTADVLPAWLKSIPFDVEDADVSSLVQAVAEKLAIPHYTGASALATEKLDINDMTYSRTGRLSPFGMLRALSDKFGLGFDVRADEAGKLFLWTTTQKEAASFNQRFAHIRPAR
jgi:hypothetical protein